MTLDREQWLHLARANAEILRADIEGLRGLITDSKSISYAEFWAQARDLATKFKTFKPLEVEARETLWAEYRATCEATRALQDSERVHLHDESRAIREHIEAELAKVLGMVESATTVQELSKAQSLLDRVLNQMKTRRRQEPKKEAAEAPHPAAPGAEAEAATAPVEAAPQAVEAAHASEAETAEAAGVLHPEEAAGEMAEVQDQAAVAEALASETAPSEEPAPEVVTEAAAPPAEAPAVEGAPAPAPVAQEPERPQLVLLRSDREACWAIWTKVREDLRAKRAGMRRELLEGVLKGAHELDAASESEDPKAVQDRIRAAQAALKEAGLLPSEQDAVRGVLRTAWKRCSERIESTRTERQKAHKEWVERMSTHIGRWEKQVLRNQVTAVQIQAEVADLESQAAATHDEDKVSRLRRWIDGKRGRLTELEKSSKEMEEKVHSVRVKMGKEAPAPITELTEEEIAALQQVRQSPPPDRERRPRPAREDRGGRGPRERDDRPKEPPTHPGLNLGELLAQHLKLANDTKSE